MPHDKLIAGNWKMNGNIKLIEEFVKKFPNIKSFQNIEVLICPSFPYLGQTFEAFKRLGIKVGAQDCHYKANGAHTGDVSSKMISELGASYIIIGHSERRDNYQSEDLHIFEKVKRVIDENLTPIICIGENLAERQNNDTEAVLKNQLNFFLKNDLKEVDFVVAYEPKWAIGSGQVASLPEINKTHTFIRETISQAFNMEIARSRRIIYGGSVKPDNSEKILKLEEVDGVLIGGASLNPQDFFSIIKEFKKV